MKMKAPRCLCVLLLLLLAALGAHSAFSQTPTKKALPNRPQPTKGTLRALFIYVKFSDDTFENDCTSQWDSKTYNTKRPLWTNNVVDNKEKRSQTSGSLSDYFATTSYGQFRIIGDTYPKKDMVYVPPHPESYYARDPKQPRGDPLRRGIGYVNAQILKDLDDIIDYRRYDTNPKDGILDMVFILYRAYSIMPTAGKCVGSYTGVARLDPCNDGFFPITLDGIEIRDGEFGSGVTLRHALQLDEVRAVLAHEYAHHWYGSTHLGDRLGFFGFPAGTGLGAFDKIKLGWIRPRMISESVENLVINDIATDSTAAFKIALPGQKDRFLLLENRQRTIRYEQQFLNACGDTSGLPATGLLITEIGKGAGHPIKEILDTPLGIKAADSTWSFPGDAGDTYKLGRRFEYVSPMKARVAKSGVEPDPVPTTMVKNIRQEGNKIIVDVEIE